MKDKNELKITLISVISGTQMCKKERLRNVARNELKREKWQLTHVAKTLATSWTKFVASKLLEFLSLLLGWSGGGRAWW